jgi:4-amino-4-deoxychorismate lyase
VADRGTPIRCLIDGAAGNRLPITDRGLAYGDGLFETIAVRGGQPCQWPRHWSRLGLGCKRIGLQLPSEATVAKEVARLLQGIGHGVLKLLVTRGDGGRGYAPPTQVQCRRILALYPAPEYPAEWSSRGVAVRFCRTPATQSRVLAGVKHLNRLDSVLARAEWSDPGIAEGLLLGPEGEVIGGTMTNLFLWDGTGLRTPRVDRCGIAGTVRALAIELAVRRGMSCTEQGLSSAEVLQARGLFLTNSVVGVWPVRRLDGRRYDPGELPLDLIRTLEDEAQTSVTPA